MPQHALPVILLGNLLIVAAVFVIWMAAHRWQKKVWLRERGEQPTGFPVEQTAERERR